MQVRNYQKELDQLIERIQKEGSVPSLLLHACCAPCSSYVLSYLSDYFRITVVFYNPNITSPEEYRKRADELTRLISELPAKYPIAVKTAEYDPQEFLRAVKGLEQEPEGGKRCEVCFRMRLSYAGRLAAEQGFDYFTTTLSISPLKNATLLNSIGEQLASEIGIPYLTSDFKKKGGYQKSIELSREYDLYRQDYCGCVFSLRDRNQRLQGGSSDIGGSPASGPSVL